MSSSAPQLQREKLEPEKFDVEKREAEKTEARAGPDAIPFCYAEAQSTGEATGSGEAAGRAAEERLRRVESEAFERGQRTAEQKLRASADAAVSGHRQQVLQALSEFAREKAAYYRRIESEVVRLALAIARKILHREVQLDPNALAGIVRVTLEKLDAGTKVDLHVHPREATDWRHYFASQAESALAPEVHEDAALAAGECRIETSLGTTEIGIESQLKEIETGLLDLLAERPEAGGVAATKPLPGAGARQGESR